MQYVDFEPISGAFAHLWNHEYTGRCAVRITAPKKKIVFPECKNYDELVKIWTDGEEIVKRNRLIFDNTYFLGEAFPLITLNLGAAGQAGFFKGCKHKFAETVWFFPLETGEELVFSKDMFLYKATMELARYLASDANGDYIIAMPDSCGNIDALSHLRGSQNLMMSMMEESGRVKSDLAIIQKSWETMIAEVYPVIKDNNYGGSAIGWMGTYAHGLHSQLQADMSVMLSHDFFDEFIIDELKRQCDVLEYPTYHLDGIEQIRHLDKLLSLEKLRMIQYTCVVGQPSPLEKLDVLKKIQASGKILLILTEKHPEWVKPLLENLSAKNLFLSIEAETPDDADDLFRIVCDYSKIR
jgi:hypothetical protein